MQWQSKTIIDNRVLCINWKHKYFNTIRWARIYFIFMCCGFVLLLYRNSNSVIQNGLASIDATQCHFGFVFIVVLWRFLLVLFCCCSFHWTGGHLKPPGQKAFRWMSVRSCGLLLRIAISWSPFKWIILAQVGNSNQRPANVLFWTIE